MQINKTDNCIPKHESMQKQFEQKYMLAFG